MECDNGAAGEAAANGAGSSERPRLVDYLSNVGEREAKVRAGRAVGAELFD